jgi:putative glutamine amidotransferase
MPMGPIIGVTHCRSLADYLESIRRVGGQPRVLDQASDRPADVIPAVDGLLFTGGGDIDPAHYSEERVSSVTSVDRGRDDYEIDLIRQGLAARLSVLGICRGMQVLNVALGGSLVQDLPSEVPGVRAHSVPTPLCSVAHEVWITRGSLLWRLMQEKLADADACSVNSRHHQAVKRLAPGLDVSATAPDGVVEAVERAKGPFCLGVQWHPENFWRTGEFRALFEGFVDACRKQ